MASKPRKTSMPTASDALPGRPQPMAVPETHFVNGNRLAPPFPAGLELALFGMGCFWGAERLFWELPGVWSTSVGYAGGFTPNPSYQEVCTRRYGPYGSRSGRVRSEEDPLFRPAEGVLGIA